MIYEELFVARCYSRGWSLSPSASVVIKAPRPNSIVVDAGANIGLFSLWAAQQAPNLKIVAFEPIPPIVEVLKRNLLMNLKGAAEAAERALEMLALVKLVGEIWQLGMEDIVL